MTARPRVLVILENNPLAKDGRVRKQVETLARAGFGVSLICKQSPSRCPHPGIEGVKLYEYPPPPEPRAKAGFLREYAYSWLMATLYTARVLAGEGFDVIQACQPPDIYFLLAAPLKLLRKRFVVDQRDPSPELYRARYGERRDLFYRALCTLERVSYRFADHVLCVNGTMLSNALERGSRAVTVVGNGPVLAHISGGTVRPELKAGRTFLCCYVGEMGRQDRVDLALLAVRHLVHQTGRRDCRFVFIGEGECLAELRKLADDLGLSEWVTFTGWLDPPLLFDYLATADLGLDSGLQEEVTPVKALEYMAVGLPFTAFDLKETRALGEDAASYVAPGDAAGLAACIDDLLEDPARRRSMGDVGRRRVEAQFAWERQGEVYLEVYRHVLRGRAAAPSPRRRGLLRRRTA